MNKKCIIVMKRHFLSLVLFAALVPFSACSNQALAQKYAHHHLRALSDAGFIQAVNKQASLVKFHKNLPSYSMASSKAIDPGETFTAYNVAWFGQLEGGSCQATYPAPTARCGGQGTIEIMDGFSNSIHDCETDVTDPAVLVCAPQNGGLLYVSCVGEAAVDRELSVSLPADTAVCDGNFVADEYPGQAIQVISLATLCGDQWIWNDDTCSTQLVTLDTGEKLCGSGDDCGDSTCTASLPAVTVTSTGQYQAECTYVLASDGITDPPTYPPGTKDPTTPPVTSPPVTRPPVTSPPVTSPPVTSPPVTSPPSTTSSCDAVSEQVNLCIASELDSSVATDCTTCIQNAIDSMSTATSCDELEPAICSILSCSCGSCIDEIQATTDCVGDETGCQFECGTSPPVTSPPVTSPPVTSPPVTSAPVTSPPSTTSSCDAVSEQMNLCIASELDSSVATDCTTCIQNAIDSMSTATSCDELEPAICSILSCSCGSCIDEIQATTDCAGDEIGCQFECDPTSPPVTDPPVTSPPVTSPPLTSPPSTTTSCDAIMDQLMLCIDSEIPLSVAMECRACVQNGIGSSSGQTSCDEIEPFACSTLSCRCESCIDEIQASINCVDDERGCQFECGNTDRIDSGGASMRFYPSVVLGLFSLICM